MFPASVARKYAAAFLEAAPSTPDEMARIAADLHDLAELVASNRELGEALHNLSLPLEQRRELLHRVIESAGGSPYVAHAVSVLIQNGHVNGLPAIDRAFREAVAARLGIVRAEVRVAAALGEDDLTRIRQALETAIGGKVELDVRVDDKLIGGFTARAGDLVFDGSIARQLERLRAQLASHG